MFSLVYVGSCMGYKETSLKISVWYRGSWVVYEGYCIHLCETVKISRGEATPA